MSRKAFANLEDAVNYLLGSDICETMTVIPPNVDELTDEDKVDEENLDASIIYDIPGGIEIVDFNEELQRRLQQKFQRFQRRTTRSFNIEKAKKSKIRVEVAEKYSHIYSTKWSAQGNHASTKFESVAMSTTNAQTSGKDDMRVIRSQI